MTKKTYFGLSVGRLILMGITAVLLVVTTLMFPPENPLHNFQVLPLFISLVVMILKSNANRYGHILGSINSLIYAAVELFIMGLYGSAMSAAFISFPLQLAAFINWSRNAYGDSTVLKKLSKKKLFIIIVSLCAGWAVFYFILTSMGSNHTGLDSLLLILGIFIPILEMLAFVDFVYFNLFSSIMSVVLSIALVFDDPSRITRFIYSIYGIICLLLAWKKMISLYKEQRTKREENTK